MIVADCSDCVAELPHGPTIFYLITRLGPPQRRARDVKPSLPNVTFKRVGEFMSCRANSVGMLPSILGKGNERAPVVMFDAQQRSIGAQETLGFKFIGFKYAIVVVVHPRNQPVCGREYSESQYQR